MRSTPFGAAVKRYMRRLPTGLGRAVCVILGVSCLPTGMRADGPPLDFRTQIAPIFQEHCIRCHSPGNTKGDISLATIDDLASYEHVIAGDPDSSHLIELLTGIDGDTPAMPKGSDPLSDEQIATLRQWIKTGADWPSDVIIRDKSKADSGWWSLQPIKASMRTAHSSEESGTTAYKESASQIIDQFVAAKLAEQNLSLNPPADRRTLIRRATYDLTGLPPTPEEVAAFVSDPDPSAYARLIDRLLQSPHYGERWGRHWLDVVRFGESVGYETNVIIDNLWPFRDYVIGSLNEDRPFDRFIREHIAGDVFGQNDPSVAIGSAFLVAGPYDRVGNQDPVQAAQIRANTLDEIIRATGEAFLGMTLGCARCHDHKFDPITQQDYYGLYATFSGVRHGSAELATPEARARRAEAVNPLTDVRSQLEQELADLQSTILTRAKEHLEDYAAGWIRPPIDRTGTEDHFEPVHAKFVRLVCESQDLNPGSTTSFRIDEFEVWSSPGNQSQTHVPRNVALAANGGKATGTARQIEDFPNAYGAHHTIDGKTGARFISAGSDLTIELAQPTLIDHVVFSSAKGESVPDQSLFVFVAEYRIEISDDGENWREVASGRDRRPVQGPDHLDHRLLQQETSTAEQDELLRLEKELAAVNQQISEIPALPSVWIGKRNSDDSQGPFHIFLGGSPQQPGEIVVPASLGVLQNTSPNDQPTRDASPQQRQSQDQQSRDNSALNESPGFAYRLDADAPEARRRQALADWIVHPENPLTPRVLANRVWHYHFGTGIVDTPSDFGFMGGRPTHPELLDFLALELKRNNWQLKNLHRIIMMSRTWMQSSEHRTNAAAIDGDARLLWRFPPRRLSAEEMRDTILFVAGKLNCSNRLQELQKSEKTSQSILAANSTAPDGGPGFRLYRYLRDNVSTYVPLDTHGPNTYRRAIYHQNARASVVDLMTDFDQPDCAFSAPRRAETTTPLQALTVLNHSFTLDMARALADRLQRDAGDDRRSQLRRAYELCYARQPTDNEINACGELLDHHGLAALCRVLLNTSELIYLQ
ncbi:MAG: DUF1553 domain-containing protein [Fuerstiella sp.]|nr:DUF1553 domain-containing protein [Fuerstiella sp.]